MTGRASRRARFFVYAATEELGWLKYDNKD